MEKIRTTIYISRAARDKAREYDINISAFVEECIFDQFGYSATRHEIEKEIREAEGKVKLLQHRLESYESLEEELEKYCVLLSYRVLHDNEGWKLERYMRALDNRMREKPMCDMSFNQLQTTIEKYMEEHDRQYIDKRFMEMWRK